MQRRPLGRSGLQVSPVCLGTNVFGWTVDEATSHSILDAWVESGMNFIDTADVYARWAPGHAGGESETIIGSWLKKNRQRRDDLIIATKVGKDMGDGKVGLAPAYIRRAVEDSLRRLQTDSIDLYQSHDDDPATPLADTLGAYADLIRQGKVRAIGASNHTAARLDEAIRLSEALGLPRYECLQPLYNPMERLGFEAELETVCLKHGIGVINFYALANGFLTGKYRRPADLAKSRTRGPRVAGYLNARGFRVLDALDRVAERHGSTTAAVALAWQIARPGITAPIASATSIAQLDALIAAAALRLDPADIEAIDAASA